MMLEAVSKSSIKFKVKTSRGIQAEEYMLYFQYVIPQSNTKIGSEGKS